jgi:hypothetical protein
MNIHATCGCGATVKITPDSPGSLGLGGYGHGSSSDVIEAERKAVAEAVNRWIDAHQGCCRPDLRIDPFAGSAGDYSGGANPNRPGPR